MDYYQIYRLDNGDVLTTADSREEALEWAYFMQSPIDYPYLIGVSRFIGCEKIIVAEGEELAELIGLAD